MSQLQLPRLEGAPDAPFPPTSEALRRPNGLLAWGGDLSTIRLLNAYRQGIFPWYTDAEPILWWTPEPRCVLLPADVHLSHRTRRRHNTGQFRLSADTAFEAVVEACAAPRPGHHGTWITAELKSAFVDLHHAGLAHSLEVWRQDSHAGDRLVGGIYGLALGGVFFGESMFSRETDASKIALVALCRHLTQSSFGLLDCQVPNPHLRSMGAVEWPRPAFERTIACLVGQQGQPGQPGQPGSWQEEFAPETR